MKKLIQNPKWFKPLQAYFYYSRSERNAVIILLSLSIFTLILPTLLPLFERKTNTNFTEFKSQIAQFNSFLEDENLNIASTDFNEKHTSLFEFNPNTASKEDFEKLGLSPKIAQTIINYRTKGGFFRQTNDLKRIYGFSTADFERLAPYIRLENEQHEWGKNAQTAPQYLPQISLNLHAFDPNIAPETELLAMGLSQKVVTTLSNFRQKGGFFSKKEDFQKIYGVTPELYLMIEPYIQIADNQENKSKNKNATITNTNSINAPTLPKRIDPNSATEADWLQVRGIGRIFAARIVEYREKLGGFVNPNQLKEINGLPDSTYQYILPLLNPIAPTSVRKLKINRVTLEEIRHPYISRKQAEIIIRYRTNHSIFTNILDFQKIGIMSNDNLERLRPYLDFNQ